jgi:hypothetical protein
MFKKIGLATLAVAGVMAFATPRRADAAVRFGVGFGVPAYTYPVAPAYPYSYYGYPAYGYPAPGYGYPAYVGPGVGIGFGWGGGWGGHGFHHGRR